MSGSKPNMMPVMADFKVYPECPKEFPMSLLNESMAQNNHSQTLQRLKERGGMSPEEIVGNIKYLGLREIRDMDKNESIEVLRKNLVHPDHPYTPTENRILELSVEIWNLYITLEQQHPSEIGDINAAIHQIQNTTGMRALRRLFPYKFSIKK